MQQISAPAAMLRSLCPKCREGAVFSTFLRMNKKCPVCGTEFEREHGFFLMAIFIGYLLNAFVFAPFVLYFYFNDRLGQVVIPLMIAIIICIPITFRYSRMVWLYLDQALDPRQ